MNIVCWIIEGLTALAWAVVMCPFPPGSDPDPGDN
jgi:hypothetical protein